MRRPFRDSDSTRQSVDVFADHPDDALLRRLRPGREALATGFYTRMFIEDVQYVVPFPRQHPSWEAALVGDTDDKTSSTVTEALPSRYGSGFNRSLTEAYRDFSATCAQTIVAYGRAAYEIVYSLPPDGERTAGGGAQPARAAEEDRPDAESRHPAGFRLTPVRPYVRSPGGRHYQYVPRLDADDDPFGRSNTEPPRWIRFDPSRIVVIELPRERRRQVSRAWNGLVRANALYGATSQLLMSGSTPGYDLEAHKRAADVSVARATRDVGWNVRMLFGERQLEPYQLRRQLQFVRFKFEIRDAITAGLDEAISKAGRHLGFDASVELRGVPRVKDVDDALAELDKGTDGPIVGLYERFQPL